LPDPLVSDPVFEVPVCEPLPEPLEPSAWARLASTMVPAASLPAELS